MSKKNDKEHIVKEICKAAKLYKAILVGKRFLYVFDGRYIEVLYKNVNFKHLTGVECNMSAADFYKNALKNRLQSPQILLMCDKEAIEVQKILPFLSDTWPLCRIGRAVIRASQSCRQSCNKSQCPACGCRSRHSCTHARRFSQSFPARGWGSIPQRQGAFGRYP